jgi:DNA-binding SARP family transcriptional activator/predicted ATPase
MSQLVIEMLGPFVVTKDGQRVAFTYDKLRALLAYLAVESGASGSGRGGISRSRLAGLLWPDQTHTAAHASLRQALSRLRSLIDDRDARPPFLLVERATIQVNRDSTVQVDLDAFRETLARVAAHHHRNWLACPTCTALLESAGRLVRGDFLEDLYLPDGDLFESWASTWRERIKIQTLNLFAQIARIHERRGDPDQALAYAGRQIEIDPYHEPAHRQMMQALVRSGKRSQAIQHFNNLRRLLADELHILPGDETMALFDTIRQGAPLPESASVLVRNLPALLPRLVGRTVELSELKTWLSDPNRRLISVVGPGGVGKTRLVTEVVQQTAGIFADGVVYVPLVPVTHVTHMADRTEFSLAAPPPLAGSVAAALGLPGAADWPQALAALRNQEVLLALDGIEHGLAERERITELLAANARLVVLTTSRERLALPGEWVFGLGGLDTSPAHMDSHLESYSAGAFFCECARQVNPAFVLNDANRSSVGEICRLVDGLPLALRLAAAWVRSLSCAEIAAEIGRGLDILSGLAGADDGQGGVRGVFEQSWRRLAALDQRVFARLAVFRGGFERASAKYVAGASLESLARLVDHSLLRMNLEGRYDVHDLLSQFGAEKLVQAGEEESTRRRHFEWYRVRAEENDQLLKSKDALSAFVWLIREAANLREALAWAQAYAPDQASQLARCMHSDFHQWGLHRWDVGLSGQSQTQ